MRTKVAPWATALALGAALAVGGCSVGPRYQRPPVPLPDQWSVPAETATSTPAAAGETPPTGEAPAPEPGPSITTSATPATSAPTDDAWWKVFGDPTLAGLVDRADQQNLSVQIAGLRIAEARAELGIAVGNQFPQQQEAFASATAIDNSGNTPWGQLLDRQYADYQVGFDASWEIDLWGKYRRGVEAGEENVRASVGDYDFARVSVMAETARAYTEVRTYQVLIALARENTRVQEEGLQIAESRLRNGATSELDVAQQKTLLESTRATIPQLQIRLEHARNALGVLLGAPSDGLDALLTGPEEIPHAPTTVAVGVPADLLRRRPDVLAAEHEAAAQSARVGIAKADLYPALRLTGTLGLEATTGAGIDLDPGESPFYEVGPQLTWGFLNYGRTRNGVRVEDARYQELLVGYQDTVLRAAQEVEDALTAFVRSHDAEVSEAASVEAAQRALEIAMVQYREGAVDFQRVLDAERALLEQQNALTQTRSDSATSLIALYKALGGGWEARQGEPVVNPAIRQDMEGRTSWGDLLSKPAEH